MDAVTVSKANYSVIISGVRGVNNITCVTTPKMPIVDFVCTLPTKPMGGFVMNIANVYVPFGAFGEFAIEIHDDITLDIVDGKYVLRFTNTAEDFTGCFAVVSYIGVFT